MEEEEEAKHRRRDRQKNDQGLARHRTNKSGKSQEQQQQQPGPTDQERNPHKPFNMWAVARLKAQRPLGEWLGMTIYTFIGISSNFAAVTSSNEAGTMETQYWAWGFATMIGKSSPVRCSYPPQKPTPFPINERKQDTPSNLPPGIYISGGSSGAFINPALIITLTIFRGFPWPRVPTYILIQILGAFCGALLAFSVHRDSILYLDNNALVPDSTGVSMYTQPRDWIRPSTALTTELLGSAVLTCTIMALGDSGNSPPGAGMHALIIGLVVTATSMALSYPTRGCFNPARDLGPRLAALAVGYPPSIFSAWHSWWIWGGWVAPIVGALIGALAYDLCVFKGGESPVNYSVSRWRNKTLKGERNLLKKALRSSRHKAVERRLESGGVVVREDRR